MDNSDRHDRLTRRQAVLGLGAGGVVAVAGCLGGSESGADPVPVRGDPEADVTLEVYSDLNCPNCAAYDENGFPDVRAQFLDNERVRYEFRNLIATGRAGEQAASAAREVFEEYGNDAFWSYKSGMYDSQDRMPADIPQVFADVASSVGLDDPDAVAQAGDERAHQSTIEADVDRARSFDLPGTPSFVVNGEQVNTRGAATMEQIVSRIEQDVQSAFNQ